MEGTHIDAYDKLAYAIVRKAVYDLNGKVKCYRDSARRFFLSEWFTELTGLDGKDVLKQLGKY